MTLKKQVHFSGNIEWIDTFANEEYDRTAQQVAKLSYHDMYELLVMKSQWREELRMRTMANVENDGTDQDGIPTDKHGVDSNDDTEDDDDHSGTESTN